jgi:hypothetical protein
MYTWQDISEIVSYCQEWGKLLPVLFPERNITRKGHSSSIHIPEYLKTFRTYYCYYKLAQMRESIHATMNSIGRKLAPICPKSRKIVEQYVIMNHVDKSLIAKKKKTNWIDYSDNNRSAGLVCIIKNLT